MTGIAITLATREDAEAVGAIEKMIGHKIARVGESKEPPPEQPETGTEPRRSEPKRPHAPSRRSEPRKRAAEPAPREPNKAAAEPGRRKPEKAAEKPRAKRPDQPPRPAERSPVVEDIKGEWNGPLPSFLSRGVD
jgi:hypothetical protein